MMAAGPTGNVAGDAIILAMAAGFGLLGGLAQAWAGKDTADALPSLLRAAIVGAIAATGVIWVQEQSTTRAIVGQSLLAGYFGRAVLALLQGRVTSALERDARQRAVAVAEDAVRLAEAGPPRGAPGETDVAAHVKVTALRARLADITTARHAS